MNSIGSIGLETCGKCPSRFWCILEPTTDEHRSDMESWIYYVISSSKNIQGLHSSNFKQQEWYREITQYSCLSEFSTKTDRPIQRVNSSLWPNGGYVVQGKSITSFRLTITDTFKKELSRYAHDNFPRLRDIL